MWIDRKPYLRAVVVVLLQVVNLGELALTSTKKPNAAVDPSDTEIGDTDYTTFSEASDGDGDMETADELDNSMVSVVSSKSIDTPPEESAVNLYEEGTLLAVLVFRFWIFQTFVGVFFAARRRCVPAQR